MREAPTRVLAVLRTGRIALALALAAGALALSACGDDEDGTIPQSDADTLLGLVDQLEQNVADGNCSLAPGTVDQMMRAVNGLPEEVGFETKQDLRDLITNTENLVGEQCEEESGPDGGPGPDTGATGAEGAVPSDDGRSGESGD